MTFRYMENDDAAKAERLFSEASAPQPTQRPASNSEARKRYESPASQTSDATFPDVDPHTDWGFTPETVQEALAQAWAEGHAAGRARTWRPGQHVNPYQEKAS